jgi:hypothetical protein
LRVNRVREPFCLVNNPPTRESAISYFEAEKRAPE